MPTTKASQVRDKNNEPIHVGDLVSARARGGKHTGEVREIIMTKEQADEVKDIDVKHPPKVIFEDQHGEDRSLYRLEEVTDA